MAYGTVKFSKAEKGWGAIEMDGGYRFFEAGDRVEFEYVEAEQDSFRYVATRARKL
jgi:cold shock protein